MACRLIDCRQYRRGEKKPELPLEPMCIPAKLYYKLLGIKAAIITVCVLLLIPVTIYLDNKFAEVPEGSPPPTGIGRIVKHIPTAFLWIAAVAGIVFAAGSVERKYYAKLQDSAKNPQSFRYQGRLLGAKDPHYQLHLNYYRTNGTWVLPDGTEQNADNIRTDNQPPEEPPRAADAE